MCTFTKCGSCEYLKKLIDQTPPNDLDDIREGLKLRLWEHFQFQEAQRLAQGRLEMDSQASTVSRTLDVLDLYLVLPVQVKWDLEFSTLQSLWPDGCIPFKRTSDHALEALLSSEGSCPELALRACEFWEIHVSIPGDVFTKGVMSNFIKVAEEAYSKHLTVTWSWPGLQAPRLMISSRVIRIDAIGMDHWAEYALGRWYPHALAHCEDCGQGPRHCWKGKHAWYRGGTQMRCSACWHDLY